MHTICLTINSKYRKNHDTTKATDYIYNLPRELRNVKSITYIKGEFPCTPLIISPDNASNHFMANSNNIYLKKGNYTGKQLAEEIQNEFKEKNIETQIDISYDIVKNTFSFLKVGATPDISLDFSFKDQDCTTLGDTNKLTLGWTMGYRNTSYINTDYKTSSDIKRTYRVGIEGEGEYNRFGSRYFMLYVNDFNNNHKGGHITSYKDSTLSENNLLAKIDYCIDSDTRMVTTESVYNTKREYLGKNDINRLHIKLLDEYGRLVDLNNMDYSITLQIEIDN